MKLDKLVRQIRRDLTASPKKAAVLGLMVLVALYFWAPMVWGWIQPGTDDGQAAVAVSEVILEDDPVDPLKSAKKEGRVFSWEKVRRKLADDPRMTPAVFEASWYDPFRPAAAQATGEQTATAVASVPVSSQIDPTALGLKLTSVAISQKQRAAIINGEKYREGELVPVAGQDGKPAAGVEFRLLQVGFYEVQLEYQGRTYTLELNRPRLAPGDALNRSN